jgi:hypothetical protein
VSHSEDRRIRWMKHHNIKMWFDNWEHDLVELGMAVRDEISGKVVFPRSSCRTLATLTRPASR